MARMTIYIPDDLKARMDEAGENTNWSEIAQKAFEAAVSKPGDRSDEDVAYWRRYPTPGMNIDNLFIIAGGRRHMLTDLLADRIREAVAAHTKAGGR